MSKNRKVTLDKENREINIETFRISNPDIYDFLKDKDNLEDWLEKALIIGCVGLRQMVLTENVDFVEKEFNKFIVRAKKTFEDQSKNIDDKIESTFSLENVKSPLFQMKELIDGYFNKDKGQIKQIIDDTFNIDNKRSALSLLIEELRKNSEMDEKKLYELLDSNKTDSPARQLKEQILDRLNEIRDQLIKESAVELEKQKGTSKGIDFEEEVYETLQALSSYYENTIGLTGGETGIKGKKGDILIELENKKSVTIECKNSSAYSSRKCVEEIKDAINNRKSSYGIFLFAKREQMPKELCPIKITDRYIITYYDEDNLYFAYRIARLFALREDNSSEENINFEKISSELGSLEENFKNIDSIQTKASSIIKSGEYIQNNIKKVRDNIEESADKIKKVLGKKYEKNLITS